MQKTVYLVTHGEKFNDSPDPGMTELGKQQIVRLIPELKKIFEGLNGCFPEIHVGTGRRHVDILAVLIMNPDTVFFSELWGSPASKIDSEDDVAQLACGLKIPLKNFLGSRHMAGAIREVLMSLPAGSLILSGRPTLVKLDPDADKATMKSGALYALHVNDDGKIAVEIIVDGVVLADQGTGAAV